MRISFMINVQVRYSLFPSEIETKQYFTIVPAHTESADDHADACAFRRIAEIACAEAVKEMRKTYDSPERCTLSAVVAQYQFLP